MVELLKELMDYPLKIQYKFTDGNVYEEHKMIGYDIRDDWTFTINYENGMTITSDTFCRAMTINLKGEKLYIGSRTCSVFESIKNEVFLSNKKYPKNSLKIGAKHYPEDWELANRVRSVF